MIESREFTDKDRRVFGLVLGGLLIVVAYLQARKGHSIWPLPAALGTLSALAGAFLPGLLAPVLAVWMRFAMVMAAVNTFLLMGFLFLFVFVPLGLYKRLRGVDPLNEEPSTDAESYWRPHAKRSGADDYKLLF